MAIASMTGGSKNSTLAKAQARLVSCCVVHPCRCGFAQQAAYQAAEAMAAAPTTAVTARARPKFDSCSEELPKIASSQVASSVGCE